MNRNNTSVHLLSYLTTTKRRKKNSVYILCKYINIYVCVYVCLVEERQDGTEQQPERDQVFNFLLVRAIKEAGFNISTSAASVNMTTERTSLNGTRSWLSIQNQKTLIYLSFRKTEFLWIWFSSVKLKVKSSMCSLLWIFTLDAYSSAWRCLMTSGNHTDSP